MGSRFMWQSGMPIWMRMILFMWERRPRLYTATLFYPINPYTGMPYPSIPSRYVLSPFRFFWLSSVSFAAGLHPAITAHTVFPAVFFPFIYLVYHQFGKKWFKEEKNAQGIFLVFAALLCGCSAYSIYKPEFPDGSYLAGKGAFSGRLSATIGVSVPWHPDGGKAGISVACALPGKPGMQPFIFYGSDPCAACDGVLLILSLIRFRDGKRLCRGIVCCVPSIIWDWRIC